MFEKDSFHSLGVSVRGYLAGQTTDPFVDGATKPVTAVLLDLG
jgi:hypothetical protein